MKAVSQHIMHNDELQVSRHLHLIPLYCQQHSDDIWISFATKYKGVGSRTQRNHNPWNMDSSEVSVKFSNLSRQCLIYCDVTITCRVRQWSKRETVAALRTRQRSFFSGTQLVPLHYVQRSFVLVVHRYEPAAVLLQCNRLHNNNAVRTRRRRNVEGHVCPTIWSLYHLVVWREYQRCQW